MRCSGDLRDFFLAPALSLPLQAPRRDGRTLLVCSHFRKTFKLLVASENNMGERLFTCAASVCVCVCKYTGMAVTSRLGMLVSGVQC